MKIGDSVFWVERRLWAGVYEAKLRASTIADVHPKRGCLVRTKGLQDRQMSKANLFPTALKAIETTIRDCRPDSDLRKQLIAMKKRHESVPQHGTKPEARLKELADKIKTNLAVGHNYLVSMLALQKKTLVVYWQAGKDVAEVKELLRPPGKKRCIGWQKFCQDQKVGRSAADEAWNLYLEFPKKDDLPDGISYSELKDLLGIKKYSRPEDPKEASTTKPETEKPQPKDEIEEGDTIAIPLEPPGDDEDGDDTLPTHDEDGEPIEWNHDHEFFYALESVERAIKRLAKQDIPKNDTEEAAQRIELAQGRLAEILHKLPCGV